MMTRETIRSWATATAALTALAASGAILAQPIPSDFNRPEDIRRLKETEDWGQGAASAADAMTRVSANFIQADIMLPGWYVGWSAVYKNLEAQWSKVSNINYAYNDLNIVSSGQIGCVVGEVFATDYSPRREKKLDINFRFFDVMTKTRGGMWLNTLEHAYWPADSKTARFVIRLPLQEPLRPVDWSVNGLPGPAVSVEQAKGELRQWLDQRSRANSAAAVMSSFGSGEDVVAYGPYLPGIYKGRAQVTGFYADWLKGVRTVDATVTDFGVVSDGLMGAVLSRQNLILHMADGTTVRRSIRQSSCLRRAGTKWYTMMESTSYPADLKTGKIVTDTSTQ